MQSSIVQWALLLVLLGNLVGAQQHPTSYYDKLLTIPMTPHQQLHRQNQHRHLDDAETPAEEEGHPQQVDSLYQGTV